MTRHAAARVLYTLPAPPMNFFDLALIAIVGLSVLFAVARGVVRELIALATWIVGFFVAIKYSGYVAGMFDWLDVAAGAKQVLAFVLLLIVAMIVGALVARLLSGVVRVIGMGFVDRLLGAVFGLARGVAVVVVLALIAGVTTLPRHDWWQNSTLGPPLAEAALSLRPYLPREWAERLDFSAGGVVAARLRMGALACPGEIEICAES